MTGLLVLGILIIIGIVALVTYKVRSGRADKALAQGRQDKIQAERTEDADRAAAREKKDQK